MISPRQNASLGEDLLTKVKDIELLLTEGKASDLLMLLGEVERLRGALFHALFIQISKTDQSDSERTFRSALLTVGEVSARLALPKCRVYELIRQGQLPIVRFGKNIRVRPDQLDKWIAQHEGHGIDKELSLKDNQSRGHGQHRIATPSHQPRHDTKGDGPGARRAWNQSGADGTG